MVSCTDMLGYVASITSCLFFVPQIYRNYKMRRVSDLSFWMILIGVISSAAWVGYGVCIASSYVLWTNVLGVCIGCVVLGQKIYFD